MLMLADKKLVIGTSSKDIGDNGTWYVHACATCASLVENLRLRKSYYLLFTFYLAHSTSL